MSTLSGKSRTSLQVKPSSFMQELEQPSPSVVLPSSHCSEPVFKPSPQDTSTSGYGPGVISGSSWHVGPQSSPATRSPSSQPSPGSFSPLPHCDGTQSSATTGQEKPGSTRQAELQPSLLCVSPSSHSSLPTRL